MLHRTILETPVYYLFETDSNIIKNYYKMKNKNGYFFSVQEEQDFLTEALAQFNQHMDLTRFNAIVTPETNNQCFKSLLAQINLPTFTIHKKSKTDVLDLLNQQFLMKSEKQKLLKTFESMSDVKIANIAANQRNRISNLLFDIPPELEKISNILYMDDSIFTGSTFKCIKHRLNISSAFVLFSNQI
jgi:hypothetical protein